MGRAGGGFDGFEGSEGGEGGETPEQCVLGLTIQYAGADRVGGVLGVAA